MTKPKVRSPSRPSYSVLLAMMAAIMSFLPQAVSRTAGVSSAALIGEPPKPTMTHSQVSLHAIQTHGFPAHGRLFFFCSRTQGTDAATGGRQPAHGQDRGRMEQGGGRPSIPRSVAASSGTGCGLAPCPRFPLHVRDRGRPAHGAGRSQSAPDGKLTHF